MPSDYLTEYNTLRNNALHSTRTLNTKTETVVRWRALSVMFNVTCYAHVWRNNRLYDKSNVACSCGRCYRNPKRSLMIVSTHVLLLKAAESFLETSQCTNFTEKSVLRDVKKADFIRCWLRSELKNPEETEDFYEEKRKKSSVPPVLSGFGEDPD